MASRLLPEEKGGKRFGSSLLLTVEETTTTPVLPGTSKLPGSVSFRIQQDRQPLGKSCCSLVMKRIQGSDEE